MNAPYAGQDRPGDDRMWLWDGRPALRRDPGQPVTPVRIGDSERDRAVSSLGDHFAAGRLARDELDERIDSAMQARFEHDLTPLFADLPRTEPTVVDPAVAGAGSGPRVHPVWLSLLGLPPLLFIGAVVMAVLLGAPWVLWAAMWFFLCTGFWGRRQTRRRHAHPPIMWSRSPRGW